MSSVSGFSGIYALDWAQTAPGDEWGLAPEFLSVGMNWQWHGQARKLDAGTQTLWLDQPFERRGIRERAHARLRRLALAELSDLPESGDTDAQGATGLPENVMVLTDGHKLFPARIVEKGTRRLLVFSPLLPQPDRNLWISALNLAPAKPRATSVICFLPGAQIDTPKGRQPVETLQSGDLVSTRDNGAQPVVWSGQTRLSGAELYLYPHLRPLRICAGAIGEGEPDRDLWVSPEHRLLVKTPSFVQEGEVLVRARDLEDGRGVRRDFALSSVTYVHVMLERHEILCANGLACESFHPGLADPRVLSWHARSLEKAQPGLVKNPNAYGETVRRCLGQGEAEILRPALA